MHPVRELLKYTMRADRKVLEGLAAVDTEDLVRATGTSWGSVLGTLAHVLGAERVWLSRFVGNPLPFIPGIEDYPDLPALAGGFTDFWPELEMFLAGLSEAQLQADITWSNTRGETFTRPLWQPMLHLVNHSTYHRGQIATMLRQLGYAPAATDLIHHFVQHADSGDDTIA